MGEHNGYGLKKPRLIIPSQYKDKQTAVNYVIVFISTDVLAEFFINSGRLFECTRGLPKDAKMIRFAYHTDRRQWVATFEHPSFDPVQIGQQIPEFMVQYTAYERKPEEAPNEEVVDENPAALQH